MFIIVKAFFSVSWLMYLIVLMEVFYSYLKSYDNFLNSSTSQIYMWVCFDEIISCRISDFPAHKFHSCLFHIFVPLCYQLNVSTHFHWLYSSDPILSLCVCVCACSHVCGSMHVYTYVDMNVSSHIAHLWRLKLMTQVSFKYSLFEYFEVGSLSEPKAPWFQLVHSPVCFGVPSIC